jgi:hypothetical protein
MVIIFLEFNCKFYYSFIHLGGNGLPGDRGKHALPSEMKVSCEKFCGRSDGSLSIGNSETSSYAVFYS